MITLGDGKEEDISTNVCTVYTQIKVRTMSQQDG